MRYMEDTCGCWERMGGRKVRRRAAIACACVCIGVEYFLTQEEDYMRCKSAILFCKDKQPLSSHCYQEVTHCLNFPAQVLLFVQFLNYPQTPTCQKETGWYINAGCRHMSCCVTLIWPPVKVVKS